MDDLPKSIPCRAAMFDSGSVPWDHEVELFKAGPAIIVSRTEMTLREAVEFFRDTPASARSGYGVGIHEMFTATMNGRPVAVGFLNASTLERMIDLL